MVPLEMMIYSLVPYCLLARVLCCHSSEESIILCVKRESRAGESKRERVFILDVVFVFWCCCFTLFSGKYWHTLSRHGVQGRAFLSESWFLRQAFLHASPKRSGYVSLFVRKARFESWVPSSSPCSSDTNIIDSGRERCDDLIEFSVPCYLVRERWTSFPSFFDFVLFLSGKRWFGNLAFFARENLRIFSSLWPKLLLGFLFGSGASVCVFN